MVQTWTDNDEGAGGDTVLDGMINLEAKLDSVRSAFSGTAFPTDTARVVGQCCWRTDSGETEGPGLYRLKTKDPTPSNDVWIFQFGDTALTLFGESLNNAADAGAARTLLGLGSAALLVSGTGSGEVQTNSQNESDYLQVSNNLSDVTAATARTNLGLQALATLATVGAAQISAGAVARVALATIEKSFSYLSKSGAYTAAAMEHVGATVATSWTLTLPASPNAGERVGVVAVSITAGQTLTIDGGTKNIIGGVTTTLNLYETGDRCELVYDGTQWIPQSMYLAPHRSKLSIASFTASVGSTYTTLPFDTVDYDNAGIADHTSDRITIKRAGVYFIHGQVSSGQTGIVHLDGEITLNGTRVWSNVKPNVFDINNPNVTTLDILGSLSLSVGDYLQMRHRDTVVATGSGFLTAVEQR